MSSEAPQSTHALPGTTVQGQRARAETADTGVWIAVGLLAVAFAGLFFRWILKQHEHSSNAMEDWGHAYVIPLISGALVWQARKKLFACPVRAFWPGLLPLLLGIVCYVFFVVGVANHMLQGASMILTLAGACLFILGPAAFRHLFLPILYLVFTITLAERLMNEITFQLQLIASKGAWIMLSMVGGVFGFMVDLSGNVLSVGGHKLNVAQACSGMRMVVAFYALAGAVALFSCRHWWQRISLMLLAGPVAIFMNVIRVAVLGLLSLADVNFAAGDAHMLIGTLLLIPSLALFMAVVWALNKIIDEPSGGAA